VLELCTNAFERVCFVHLNDSGLCFVSCAFELMFCCLLYYKLLVCALNICALCILCYELLKKRLQVVTFWFVL